MLVYLVFIYNILLLGQLLYTIKFIYNIITTATIAIAIIIIYLTFMFYILFSYILI